ncbi:MAG: DUF4340 domain-containing protein [Lachnospiraceae bacterium]|nr:DUF4340 domain-containing protein [Lachnospiraceae bacterium]
MKKKSIKLVAGVVVIFVLCGAYFGLKSYNQKTEEAEEEAAEGETILEVNTSTLTAVSFLIDGEETSFTLQEDGTWQKDDDETFPVDSDALLSPLSELSELKSLRTLTEIEDVSEYGFDDPQNLITLTDEDGEETILTIGDTNASTGNDYLMLNDDTTTVYTIAADLCSGFSDDLYDYAESEELPAIQASTITGISVEMADGESYDLYLEDAVWMVSGVSEEVVSEAEAETDDETAVTDEEEETDSTEDEEESTSTETEVTAEELAAGVEANADEADTLTSTLAGLAYADYLEHNCSDFSAYGLEEPAVTLTITYEEEVESDEDEAEDAETEASDAEAESEEESETETEESVETIEKTVTFLIGDTDSNGDYYVRLEGSAQVHTLSSDIVTTLLSYSAYDLIAEEEEETETETEDAAEAEDATEADDDDAADAATETESVEGTDAEMETETDEVAAAVEETETESETE